MKWRVIELMCYVRKGYYVYNANIQIGIIYTYFPVDKLQICDTHDVRNMKEYCLV